MSVIKADRLHIAGGTFNQVAGDLTKYHIAGNLVQPQGENGIGILQRSICGDAFYNSEQRFPPPQCHPNTRMAVQDTIYSWAEAAHAPRMMWLYGPAGGGKSAIAQTMAERWTEAECLGAAFFFARWRMGGSSGKTLFPTIAYQLAQHIPALRRSISEAVERDPAVCDKSLEEQARVLIRNPVAALPAHNWKPYLVIVDGLDECEGKPAQSRIIRAIFHISANNTLPLRFLICSRPEPHIRETFQDRAEFCCVSLDDIFEPSLDIRRYLRDKLADVQRKRLRTHPAWPSDADLGTLVKNASGQFIYAATVIKFVDDEYSHPVEQLRLVLRASATQTKVSAFEDLDNLYSSILSQNPDISLVIRILGAFFAIPDPDNPTTHCVEFLDNILGLERGTVRFALRGLHSMLFIPDSDGGRIRVHHASFHDFLSNPTRAGQFYLAPEAHHTELLERCLTVIVDSIEGSHPSNTLYVHSTFYSFHLRHRWAFRMAYAHKEWTKHYIPSSNQHRNIRACLRACCATLQPHKFDFLCHDLNALMRIFLYFINFLKTLGTTAFALQLFIPEYDAAWNTLLATIFERDPSAAELLPFWTPALFQYFCDANGKDIAELTLPSPGSLNEIPGNLPQGKNPGRQHPTPQIYHRAAQIALRLLIYRSAEIRTNLSSDRLVEKMYARIVSDVALLGLAWTEIPSKPAMCWYFAHQWCIHLVQTPPASELLPMLRHLLQSGEFLHEDATHYDMLNEWLNAFDTEPAMAVARVFQHVEDHAFRRD
ncbi:hypothetical protein C8R47DRAFT_133759 [Mycena vitilis]|nr:hypothetical protein C8R47DRAFT_133759 [Mycena vitilis]